MPCSRLAAASSAGPAVVFEPAYLERPSAPSALARVDDLDAVLAVVGGLLLQDLVRVDVGGQPVDEGVDVARSDGVNAVIGGNRCGVAQGPAPGVGMDGGAHAGC